MGRIIPPGSMVITPRDARALYQAADLETVRKRHRALDTPLYQLLVEIAACAQLTVNIGNGSRPRQEAASEEHDFWTTRQLARASRRSERTVRLDCQERRLQADRSTGYWVISNADATTYIRIHKPH